MHRTRKRLFGGGISKRPFSVTFYTVCLLSGMFGGGYTQTVSPGNTSADTPSTPEEFTIDSVLDQYNGHSTRPGEKSGNPVTIWCTISEFRIDEVDQINQEFKIVVIFYLSWTDNRLQDLLPNDSDIVYAIRGASIDKIWLPDLYFPLLKSGDKATTTNRILRIHRNDGVIFGTRLSVTQCCSMDFTLFPFDSQTCHTIITTFSYLSHEMELKWNETSQGFEDMAELNVLEFIRPRLQKTEFTKFEVYNNSGSTFNATFSCLKISIRMDRESVYYIFTSMMAMLLLAWLSWLNYWLDPEQTPARVSLGITTVLSAITQINNTLKGLPLLSYITALDVWMYTCLHIIIVSLYEYAVVHILVFAAKRQEKELKRLQETSRQETARHQLPNEVESSFYHGDTKPLDYFTLCRTSAVSDRSAEEDRLKKSIHRYRWWARKIDMWMRMFMPVVLILFTGVYVGVYCFKR